MNIEITPIRNGYLVAHGPNKPVYMESAIDVLEYIRSLLTVPEGKTDN